MKSTPDVARLAAQLAAMGTEPRLRIMRLLLAAHPAGLVAGDIAGELGIPGPTLSHHLDKLKQSGLVRARRERQFLWYTAETGVLRQIVDFLYEECCTRSGKETTMSDSGIRDIVKEKYGEAALRVYQGKSACCGSAPSSCCETDPITSNLYQAGETTGLPEEAVLASLGCGNPTALAQLQPGETVLDLGSGGGIDVLLSARRVGRCACCRADRRVAAGWLRAAARGSLLSS